jgi:hypothetical protein
MAKKKILVLCNPYLTNTRIATMKEKKGKAQKITSMGK